MSDHRASMLEIGKSLLRAQQFTRIIPDPATMEKFKKLKTDHQRVNFAYKFFSTFSRVDIIEVVLLPRRIEKSNQVSLKLRQKGNEMFRIKKSLEALLLYTESVSFAEKDSPHLGLAYSNRSAVLFEKGYYKECLEDIDRALQNNYPDHLKQKLINRQIQASVLHENIPKTFHYYEPAPQIVNKHPRISSAADCVELKKTDSFGTHVVTTRDVKAGEILSVEKPFVTDVVSQSKLLHCHECLELCFNMIPCDNCSTTLYCSATCLTAAYAAYHRYECDFGAIVEDKLLAIKATLLSAAEYKRLQRDGEAPMDEIYRSDRYKEVWSLEANENTLDGTYLFTCAAIAGIVFKCLKTRTKFLQENDLDEEMVKGLVLHNILVENTNSIAIDKFREHAKVKQMCVGRGVSAFSSRYNHSCAPNCCGVYHGTSLVIRAVQDIKRGEQCTVSYGCSYMTDSLAERQKLLQSRYFFKCVCVACTRFWPTYPNLNSHESVMEALHDLMTHVQGTNYCLLPAIQLHHVFQVFSRTKITKADRDETLATCFYLQKLLVEPRKALVYIKNVIFYMYRLLGNTDVGF